jgi:hypothetical protein
MMTLTNLKEMKNKLGSLTVIASLILVLTTSCQSPSNNGGETDQSIELSQEYTNRTFDFVVKYPTDWVLEEESEPDILSFDKFVINPPDYSAGEPLITIEMSTLSFEQNQDIIRATSSFEILSVKDSTHETRPTKLYTVQMKETDQIRYMYLLEHIAGSSILFTLRSDDEAHKAIFDAMWEQLNVRR